MTATPEVESAKYWLTWLRRLGNIATFCVAAGVAGEVLVILISEPFQKTVEAARQLEIARLEEKAAGADARANEARKQAEQARLAQEELHAENLRLEALIQPRRLNAEQQRSLREKAREYPATAKCWINGGDPESAALAAQLGSILLAADWDVHEAQGVLNMGGDAPVGVSVTGTLHAGDAANVIVAELNAAGIAAELKEPPKEPPWLDEDAPPYVNIRVGAKPLPKLE